MNGAPGHRLDGARRTDRPAFRRCAKVKSRTDGTSSPPTPQPEDPEGLVQPKDFLATVAVQISKAQLPARVVEYLGPLRTNLLSPASRTLYGAPRLKSPSRILDR